MPNSEVIKGVHTGVHVSRSETPIFTVIGAVDNWGWLPPNAITVMGNLPFSNHHTSTSCQLSLQQAHRPTRGRRSSAAEAVISQNEADVWMYEAADQYSYRHIGHAACRATGTALDSSCHLPHINPANARAASCTIRLAQTRERFP